MKFAQTASLISALLFLSSGATAASGSSRRVARRDIAQNSNNQQVKANSVASGTATSSAPRASSTKVWSQEYGLLQFQNVGYEGSYFKVSSINSSSDDACNCELNRNEPWTFSGTNAPLDEELSVQFRGPINLQKFAFFTADAYTYGDTDGSWSRKAYFDVETGTAENVTFLANVGENVTCLGNALEYVDSDGVSPASEPTVLRNVTIESNQEFIIMSNVSCEDSGWNNDCGVYRDGIPAYHGYYGTTKMFLFQFEAPLQADVNHAVSENSTYYDLSAIWLLNANIPRTAQYPLNGNCSSWNSGGGEFDIFEVMNSTESTHFYSTIHDYQGTDDIYNGIQNFGFIERTPGAVMSGGVVFGSDGIVSVFLSNDTTFDDNLDFNEVSTWLSTISSEQQEEILTMATVTAVSTTSTSKSKGGASDGFASMDGLFWKFVTLLMGLMAMI